MIRQNFKENQNLAQEKYHEFQSNKHAQEQMAEQIKAQMNDALMVEMAKKQNDKDYKRRYLEYLNQQVLLNMKKSIKIHHDYPNAI